MWSRRAACESITTRLRFLPVPPACAARGGALGGLPRAFSRPTAVAPLRPAAGALRPRGFVFGSAPAAARPSARVASSTLEDAVFDLDAGRRQGSITSLLSSPAAFAISWTRCFAI